MLDRGLISNLNSASRALDSIVALRASEALDWACWTAQVRALAGHLATLGDATEASGGRWALFCDDGYDFAVGLFGLWLAGKTPVLPPNATPGTLALLAPHVQGSLGDMPDAVHCTGYEVVDATQHAHFASPDSALILFTSGSTGEPKQIHKTVRQLESELEVLASTWEAVTQSNTFISSVSHQHIYGLLLQILLPLTTGRVFESRLLASPSSATRFARTHEAVAWISSPAQLKRLDPDVVGRHAPAQLKCIVSSGGLLEKRSADVISQWWGQPPIEIYGSTESGGVAYRQQQPAQIDTRWRPLPKVAIRAGERQRLLVRSTQADGANWLAMDDAIELFPDGTFTLSGRLDRIVKIEEKRLSLEALEARLRELPQVADARSLLIPGERDTLAAALVLTDRGASELAISGKAAFNTALRNTLTRDFERVTLPRRWRFVAALPTNAQGKIQQGELLKLFEQPAKPQLPVVEQSTLVDDSGAQLTLLVPDDLAYLEGHFPGEPILPGVVQILWARHFGKTLLGFPGVVTRMKRVKFKHVIRPRQRIYLRLDYHVQKAELRYRYRSDLDECSSGVLLGS